MWTWSSLSFREYVSSLDFIRKIKSDKKIQKEFVAEYDEPTQCYRVRYSVNSRSYTLVIPARYTRDDDRRRYKYVECESNRRRRDIEAMAGPCENFHGIPLTMNDIGMVESSLLEIDTYSRKGSFQRIIKPGDRTLLQPNCIEVRSAILASSSRRQHCASWARTKEEVIEPPKTKCE